MPAPRPPEFDTLALHAGQRPDAATGARAVPIYETTSYVFADCDHAAELFNLERAGHIYSRISNPTTAVLEERVAALENGVGAVAAASGMAALHLAIATLAGAGDHIVASSSLYGGTINLLAQTLPRFGIATTFVKPRDHAGFAAAMRENTKLVIAVPAFDKAERPGNRRMATLAAVYTINPYVRTAEQIVAALFRDDTGPWPKDRPQPRFKHLTARFTSMREDPDGEQWESNGTIEAFCWADEQIDARRHAGQKVLRLMDGQASLWDAADNCLSVPPEETIDILDILHVSSYIWRAAKVFYPQREHQEAFARDRLLRMLQGDVHKVVAGLRQMATKRRLKRKGREDIATVCGYFEKHAHRMHYDEYLAAGYPIATGVIEGACRHLVKDRMERSGMRWRLAGAQPMLHVRAVYQSSYWDDFHQDRIAREQRTLHPHRALLGDYHPVALAG